MKPQPPRGICSVCQRMHAIKASGVTYRHTVPKELFRIHHNFESRPICEGSGLPPEKQPVNEPARTAGQPEDPDLQLLVERVNGFVYPGDRLNAVVETVNALRADPQLAWRLFERR